MVDLYALNTTSQTDIDRVYQNLRQLNDNRFTVFRKNSFLDRLHYNQAYQLFPDRAPDLFISVSEGCALGDAFYVKGDHGYDNQVEDMGALFIAAGAKIEKMAKPVKPF